VIDLSVNIAGVKLSNPVLPASGTWEVSSSHEGFYDPGELGAVISKTIYLKPRPGNPPPRIVETPCGMLNAIGIPGEGAKAFIAETLPLLHRLGPPVIVSIAGDSVAEFASLAELISDTGLAHFLELNLSCPNLQNGIPWATDPIKLDQVISQVVKVTNLPVIAKLSPAVTDIAAMGLVAEQAGARALAIANTHRGMVIDIHTHRPVLGNVTGGLSGPAVRPLAVYAVYVTYPRVKIPIIGIGGICRWQDAVEFLLAGSTAVSVGTASFTNPVAMKEVVQGLEEYLRENGFRAVQEIVGLAQGSHG
jgi:dihydroorotate dehydrogenase (NAD+) catalytic subunit